MYIDDLDSDKKIVTLNGKSIENITPLDRSDKIVIAGKYEFVFKKVKSPTAPVPEDNRSQIVTSQDSDNNLKTDLSSNSSDITNSQKEETVCRT